MTSFKRLISFILVLFVVMSLFIGCSKSTEEDKSKNEPKEAVKGNESDTKESKSEDKVKISLGIVVTEDDPMYLGAKEFKKSVEEKTNNEVIIDLYPSSQLGDTTAMIESIESGKDIATLADAGRLANYLPKIGILGAPFLIDNYDEAKKMFKSDEWKAIEDELAETSKIKILSFNWYQGARNLLTNKPIKTPEDLKGVKLRTIDSPVFKLTIEGMGAVPMAQAWADVYGNVKSSVIDGCEAQHSAAYNAKLYEVLKYNTKTAHIQLLTGLVTSVDCFNKIPDKYKDIVLEEAFNAGDVASNKTIESSKDYEEKMKAEGVTFSDVDTDVFKKATESVYDELDYTELKNKFDSILGK